jgi:hypothetical protein
MKKVKLFCLVVCALAILGNVLVGHSVSASPSATPIICGTIGENGKVYRSNSGLDGYYYDDLGEVDKTKIGARYYDPKDPDWLFEVFFQKKVDGKCTKETAEVIPIKVYRNYSFKCISRGKHTLINKKFTASNGIWTYLRHEGGFDYYRLTLPPDDKEYQAIQGEVKLKRYVLSATPVDESGTVIGSSTESESMGYGDAAGASASRAVVTRPVPTDADNYTFLGWSESKSSSGVLTPENQYRGNGNFNSCASSSSTGYSTCWDKEKFASRFTCGNDSCADKTVYAVYKYDRYKLTAEPIDATTGNIISSSSIASTTSSSVAANSSATVRKPDGGDSWQFIGWHTNKGIKKYDGDGLDRSVTNYSKTISGDETVYAYFVRKWNLSKNQGQGTTITVTRNESLYGGASVGSNNLANGTILYQGDKITASFSTNAGYSWGSNSFKGNGINQTKTENNTVSNHIVKENVLVESTAKVDKYRLTGTAIDVDSKLSISRIIPDVVSSEVTYNQNAEVTRIVSNEYDFIGWHKNPGLGRSLITNKEATYSEKLTSNATVYAYYAKKWKLTIDAGTGTSITVKRVVNGGFENLTSGATLYEGDQLMVSMCISNGYSWNENEHKVYYKNTDGTSLSKSGSQSEANPNCYVLKNNHTVHSDVKVKTRANENGFEGKSDVGSSTTDWSKTNKTVYYQIDNCSPTNGCKVTFKHYLRRSSGEGEVSYSINRTSNYSKNGVSSTTLVDNAVESFGSENSALVYTDGNLVLYPGQKVCETLTFKPSALRSDTAELKTCALALGKAQPEGDGAFINIKVKNATGNNAYKTYQKYVYAKPGDELTYLATYHPVLQYAYYLYPEQFQIDGGAIKTGDNKTLGSAFNTEANKNGIKNWNNAFTVNGDDFKYAFTKTYTNYALGSTSEKSETNPHLVDVHSAEVGKELKEVAITNNKEEGKTTPSQIIFTRRGDEILSNVITTSISSNAIAAVPYNFNTSAEVTSENEVLIAGGSTNINYKIDILPKENKLTTNGGADDAYSTIIRNAKSKVIVYTTTDGPKNGTAEWGSSDLCAYFRHDSCRYEDERQYESLEKGLEQEFKLDAPDVTAGYKICIAIAFYPASSGADNNLSAAGSGKWRISNSKCFTVGKNPTFQVWGGSFYSNIKVSTSTTIKRRLANVSGELNNPIIFSSWAELSVVSNDEVKGLTSGAATGLANNQAGGGSQETGRYGSYCKYRVPLSLANFARTPLLKLCTGSSSDGASGYSGITIKTNKETFTDPLPEEVSETINYSAGESVRLYVSPEGVDTIRHIGSGSLVINTSTIAAGKTHIVKASGNVTINGNIEYANYGNLSYSTLTQIPKLIVYASGDININCEVNRIDAVLIANGTVNSCSNSTDINSRANSNQLIINGAILTGGLVFNRTFGASTGTHSKIPAEIVNFDTSLLLWGRGKVDTDDSRIHQVYLHELAPRY